MILENRHKEILKKILPVLLLLALVGGYAALKLRTGTPVVLLLDGLFIVFGYLAAWQDIQEQRIPNKLILLMLAGWVLVMVPQLLVSASAANALLVQGIAGFVFGGILMLVVYLVSKKGLGGGDVKFVAAAGCYLGVTDLLSGILLGSVLAALVGITMILTKRMKRTDSFPFAPYLYFGMLLTVFLS